MGAAYVGYTAGVFLAAGGFGYIFIGLLKLLTIYRRWPRGSTVAACLLVLLLGVASASASNVKHEVISSLLACMAAAAFIAWRGKLFAHSVSPPQ